MYETTLTEHNLHLWIELITMNVNLHKTIFVRTPPPMRIKQRGDPTKNNLRIWGFTEWSMYLKKTGYKKIQWFSLVSS